MDGGRGTGGARFKKMAVHGVFAKLKGGKKHQKGKEEVLGEKTQNEG
jgi:hypothetical protein